MYRIGLYLWACLLLSGCGKTVEEPSPSAPSTTQASASNAAAATSTDIDLRSGTGAIGGGSSADAGGGTASASAGGSQGQRRPSGIASTGAQASDPKPPHTRAEIEQSFERDSHSFPSEPSLNPNPAEVLAKTKPRTIENVKGLNGYQDVLGKYQPGSSFEAVQAGKKLYTANCIRCHSEGGAPTAQATERLSRYSQADLSVPLMYKYGADGRGIFRSIAYGTAAPPHGMYNGVLQDQQIWSIVAYVQSLQKARR